MNNRCIAIIPARGGSQGIPRKNIKNLCGKPLIGWMIEAAFASETVERVIVSTEDAEIACVARSFGAEVVCRPMEIAGGLSRSEDALLHVLDELGKTEKRLPEVLAFLQCTSPLTLPEDIDGTVRLVCDSGYDSAVTCRSFHGFIWSRGEDGTFRGVNHDETKRLMRQERSPEFLEVGAVYAMRVDGFRKNGFRFFGKIGMHAMDAIRTLEIDDPQDWQLAEYLLPLLRPADVAPTADDRVTRIPPVSELDVSRIKAVITDFDGVLTDNRVSVDAAGNESVTCNRADGWGIQCLRESGFHVACISTETNKVVSKRCEKLSIPCIQGVAKKKMAFEKVCSEWGVAHDEVLYVGNDTNDADCLSMAGVGVVPADAVPAVAEFSDGRTFARGGSGVLREIAALLLARRMK